jgi:hypothetical protein
MLQACLLVLLTTALGKIGRSFACMNLPTEADLTELEDRSRFSRWGEYAWKLPVAQSNIFRSAAWAGEH